MPHAQATTDSNPKKSTDRHNGPGRKRAKKAKHRGPKSKDRHWLYQESVQSPNEHIEFFDKVYSLRHGRPAASFKEDFCGTAFLSTAWVHERPDNIAMGVDLDLDTLDWGRKHNVCTLTDEERGRLTLLHENVLDIIEPKAEIVAALNFSYFEFKTRDDLREYFEKARQSLAPGGLFILDMFGGWEAQMEETDRTRDEGFTYVWEQTFYDPVNNRTQFRIHFKFHDGGGIPTAFEYNWRLWTLPEVREILEEAGYKRVDIYWEQIDDDTGEGSGEYKLVTKAESCPGWIAFIVASDE